MIDRRDDRDADRAGMPQRQEGGRRYQRRMVDDYGSMPERGERRDFRDGQNEMRAPMPPSPRDPQFDRMSPDRAPFRTEHGPKQNGPRDMMKPRPGFGPETRGDQGPRGDFKRPPFQDDRGPRRDFDEPNRQGPPLRGGEDGQRRVN